MAVDLNDAPKGYFAAQWVFGCCNKCAFRSAPSCPRNDNDEFWCFGVQQEALEFVRLLLEANIPKIALENPISIISSKIRKPDQIIQPWQFGHGETKATCLWLKGLPKLVPTNIVEGREQRIHKMPPSPTRWKERSRTYQGIADAMAQQWGGE